MGPRAERARVPLNRRVGLLALLAVAAPAAAQDRPVELTFLDVGQGDAIVVRAPGGAVALVDAGFEAPLRPLARMGVDSLALLVATHPHEGHIGGMDGVLMARPVETFLEAGPPHDSEGHARLTATVERLGVERVAADGPRSFTLGTVGIEVLPLPPPSDPPSVVSVGLLVRYGEFSALLPGDAEEAQLDHWVEGGHVPAVTVLKASQHGSEDGFTWPFVEAADPDLVVVSVGPDNPFGHPRPEALTAYGSQARAVVRTDLDGHVTVLGFPDGRWEVLAGEEIDARTRILGSRDRAASPPRLDEDSTSVDDPDRAPDGGGDVGPRSLAVEVVVDAAGFRAGDLNRDHAVIENRQDAAVDLSGWRLCDLSTRCFRFPPGSSVPPGRRVVVYTGYGIQDGVSFFMNNDRRVWNEDGDEATLYDATGAPVVRYVY